MSLTLRAQNKVFGGLLTKYAFTSEALGGLSANMNVYVPPQASNGAKVPVLYYLSGLTCTEDNAAQKGHLFGAAADEGLAIVFPDTSPRGANLPGEDDNWDFGTGAGFYVNATKAPWSRHYRMYDHVLREIPAVIEREGLPIDTSRASILGHSMGGHGALMLYLREPGTFRAASAFSPMSHPTNSSLGQKLINGYLEGGIEEGKAYDAAELLSQVDSSRDVHILVDCGLNDGFYKDKELQPESLTEAAKRSGIDAERVQVRMHEGYDHSCTSKHCLTYRLFCQYLCGRACALARAVPPRINSYACLRRFADVLLVFALVVVGSVASAVSTAGAGSAAGDDMKRRTSAAGHASDRVGASASDSGSIVSHSPDSSSITAILPSLNTIISTMRIDSVAATGAVTA